MVWKQLCDPNGFNGPVAQKYNITGVPTCILLDKEGRIFKTEMRGAALDAVFTGTILILPIPPATDVAGGNLCNHQ